jgi:hypothetical protein
MLNPPKYSKFVYRHFSRLRQRSGLAFGTAIRVNEFSAAGGRTIEEEGIGIRESIFEYSCLTGSCIARHRLLSPLKLRSTKEINLTSEIQL